MGVVKGDSSAGRRWLAGATTLLLLLAVFPVALADHEPTFGILGSPEFDGSLDDVTLKEGETLEIHLNDHTTDPDGDALVFDVEGLPGYGDFDRDTGIITLSPGDGDAHSRPRTVTVTAYKDVGFNRVSGGITLLWSEQEGQTSGHLPDRNRVLGGYQVVGSGSVGQAIASGSGVPTGEPTAPSERNRSAFTVALVPATAGEVPQFIGARSNAEPGAIDPTLEIDRPGGVQVGDLLVAHIRYRHQEPQNGGPEPDGAPNLTAEGWEKVATLVGDNQANHSLLCKFFESGDPNPYVFDENDPTGRMAGGIAAFRGVDTTTPIEWESAEQTSVLAAPGLDFSASDTVVVRMWGWHGFSASLSGELPDPPHSEELTPSTSFDVTVTESTGGTTAAAVESTTTMSATSGSVVIGSEASIANASSSDCGEGTSTPSTTTTTTTTTSTSMSSTTTSTTTTSTTTTTVPSTPPLPEVSPSTDWFVDDGGHLFEDDINAVATAGFARGCNPPANDRYCPEDLVTRGQMAAFLVRALGYSDDGGGNLFADDDGHVFEGDIDRLAAAGVTRGCNPPNNDRFCPDEELTRGQMAAFLVRALGYSDDSGGDLFTDDDGSVFEGDIDRLATAGVTRGCNPPDNDRFCPADGLTRGQMAAFLARALIQGG